MEGAFLRKLPVTLNGKGLNINMSCVNLTRGGVGSCGTADVYLPCRRAWSDLPRGLNGDWGSKVWEFDKKSRSSKDGT